MRFKMQKVVAAILIVVLLFPPSLAFGWSAGGHRIVAVIAFDQLSREKRDRVLSILSEHPRREEDFSFPERLPRDETTRNKWLFSQAAVWPDKIRGRAEFDRPKWHYINKPFYLGEVDEMALSPTLSVNLAELAPADAGLATKELNVAQAIALCRKMLSDSETSMSDKALCLCWLFHLVGDIHQPCHSTALFSKERFPTGDKGGNRILLLRGGKLHALWDGLLGRSIRINTVLRRVADITSDDEIMEEISTTGSETNVSVWLTESHRLAKEKAYHEQILEVVKAGEDDTDEDLPRIRLPRSYYENAGETARLRVAQAGFRLAAILEGTEF